MFLCLLKHYFSLVWNKLFSYQSEKAQAEREIKHLHSQRTLLERDVSKRDSVARRESKALDFNKSKGHGAPANQIRQVVMSFIGS